MSTPYFDMHLSMLAQELRYGFLGKIDVAIVEAADVTEDGEIVPTSGVGIPPHDLPPGGQDHRRAERNAPQGNPWYP